MQPFAVQSLLSKPKSAYFPILKQIGFSSQSHATSGHFLLSSQPQIEPCDLQY